ncbi:aromatic ring-hydroxylating dioxygenase subunit alpha [Sphingobium sp. Sx8-8]|uniref:aromatic ring-hydroxylating oxygenase subunit alpha n=1 Tax=Sphingobium sp. Sx8-8 TaxID=2933617 RepID=UPI001F59506F|nr:aromatic ring-hydroxylating dioxygenase subunit alpha [Sphingobium sp. Sx8-8]
MAEADLCTSDRAARRRQSARADIRRMVALIAGDRTDCAAAPLVLDKSIYTGRLRHAAEMDGIFRKQPLIAGLSGDIPEPGDALVFDAAGPSVLVMRGKDGTARAFLNMCTHRAARLVEEQEPWRGRLPRVACPFHAWTFDGQGRLVGQPGKEGFAGCPEGARDLVGLPCEEHLGLIFVRLDPPAGPVDATAHLGAFAPVLEQMEPWRAEPVKKGVLRADANWKFALDTYGESYHFKSLHKSTIGQTHYSNRGIYQPVGQHHRVNFPDLSMGELVSTPEAEWPEAEYGGVHYIFPNTVLFFGAVTPGVHFTQLFRLFPDGPDRMICHFAVYAPFGVIDDAHRAVCEEAYDATAGVVQTEDYRVASAGYANMLSAPDGFQVVLGANEPALHGVHRHIAEACGMPLDRTEPAGR